MEDHKRSGNPEKLVVAGKCTEEVTERQSTSTAQDLCNAFEIIVRIEFVIEMSGDF